jgi:outer membrane protein assembly factor BamB
MGLASLILFAGLIVQGAGVERVQDSNWTRFRGFNGSGLSELTGFPVLWRDTNTLWKLSLPGRGHSSPVIWNDNGFVTSSDEEQAVLFVQGFRMADGQVIWRRQYPLHPYRRNRDHAFAASTPAADGQRVYLYWTVPEEITVVALNHQGEEVWRRNLGPFASQHGSGTSPVVIGDLLIVGNDQDGKSSVLALDTQTGQTRWETPRRSDRVAYSTPCFWPSSGRPSELGLILTSSSHGVSCLDLMTGRMNWDLTNAFPFRVVNSPILTGSSRLDSLIIASCGEGGIGRRLVAVKPGADGKPPRIVYEMKERIPYVPTPLAQGEWVFLWGDNGVVSCLRGATGEQLWSERLGDAFYASPIWAEGRLYCPSKKGDVYVLAATNKFELLARNPLGEACFATPACSHNRMLIRTDRTLWAIGDPALK